MPTRAGRRGRSERCCCRASSVGLMWLLPWPDARRPSPAPHGRAPRSVATAVVLLLGTVGGCLPRPHDARPQRGLRRRRDARRHRAVGRAVGARRAAGAVDRLGRRGVVAPGAARRPRALGRGAGLPGGRRASARPWTRWQPSRTTATSSSSSPTTARPTAPSTSSSRCRRDCARSRCTSSPSRERGVGCAVDAGVRFAIAHGAQLIARTDADALPRPDWVARIRDRFARGAEVVAGASVPRRDEHPTLAERFVLPAVQRLLARLRPLPRRAPRARLPRALRAHPRALVRDHRRRLRARGRRRAAGARGGLRGRRAAQPGPPRHPARGRAPTRSSSRTRCAGCGVGRAEHAALVLGPPLRARHGRRRPRPGCAVTRARRRDRRVYLASHPLLFGLLAAQRRQTRAPPGLPRRRQRRRRRPHRADGGAARPHRRPHDRRRDPQARGRGRAVRRDGRASTARRAARSRSGSTSRGVADLRPAWQPGPRRRGRPAARPAASSTSAGSPTRSPGRTTAALLGLDLVAVRVPRARPSRPGSRRRPRPPPSCPSLAPGRRYRDHLADAFGGRVDPLGKMLALAAVNTTYATAAARGRLGRRRGLWRDARRRPRCAPCWSPSCCGCSRPTPLLPRVPAAAADVGGTTGHPRRPAAPRRPARRRRPPSRPVGALDPAPRGDAAARVRRRAARVSRCRPRPGPARRRARDARAARAARRPGPCPTADAALPAWRELVVAP